LSVVTSITQGDVLSQEAYMGNLHNLFALPQSYAKEPIEDSLIPRKLLLLPQRYAFRHLRRTQIDEQRAAGPAPHWWTRPSVK
jgi:hypothetical protein